ncbi:MAG TPA: recombinase RecT [Acidimicrobiales bacterium]|nr:recombinase RecT [Acidimicrobiales bacterium]
MSTSLATDLRAARAAQRSGQPPETLQGWLQRHQSAITGRLPRGQRAQGEDRYVRLVLSEMLRTPTLMECMRSAEGEMSLRDAMFKMAQLGLEPGPLGHCYLLPFRDNRKGVTLCTFILGYRGMCELAWRSGQVRSIQARVVYEGDSFTFEYGLQDILRHQPMAAGPLNERKLQYAYAVAKFTNGGTDFIVLDREQVLFYKSKSRAGNEAYSPWNQFEPAMWRKTALLRLATELPLSVETATEFALDEARQLGYDSPIHTTLDDVVAVAEGPGEDKKEESS